MQCYQRNESVNDRSVIGAENIAHLFANAIGQGTTEGDVVIGKEAADRLQCKESEQPKNRKRAQRVVTDALPLAP